MCKVDFQLDYSEGFALTFSVTSVPKTNNPPGMEEVFKNILEESVLASQARNQVAFPYRVS